MATLDGEGPVRLAGAAAATAHDWDSAAAAVLRRTGKLTAEDPPEAAWSTLARTTVEGLTIPPLGTPARVADRGGPVFADLAGAPGPALVRVESGWDIRSLLADPDPASAAACALSDLENGVTSLWVTVGGAGTDPADLGRVLAGVLLDIAPVIVGAAGSVTDIQAAQAFAEVIRTRGVQADFTSNLGADPVGRAIRAGLPVADVSQTLGEISALATTLGIRAAIVDGAAAHEAGAGDAAELGYSLAVGAAYLRALEDADCGVEDALELLEFRYAATDDQFSTIAKFRAARGLWDRVAELCGAAAGSCRQIQHAVTSSPMLTRYDPWVNLLRTTVAAFAAGVGGADAITVLPFDSRLGIPDALGRRLARNISSLLISESHVAAVTDPAAGAHAVELMTADLAEAAWTEFQLIERSGGVVAAIADGSLSARWAVTAAERARRIATRRRPITGVSEFPNLREVLPNRRPAPGADQGDSWAAPFESMRDEPAASLVFLATLGAVADHSVRSGFAANLFAAGGVDTVTAGRTESVTDVLVAFRETGTWVACLVGSDAAYAEIGADVVAGLRAAGAVRVILAGRPRGGLADLVDDHVAAGDDVVEFLRRTRQSLFEAEPVR